MIVKKLLRKTTITVALLTVGVVPLTGTLITPTQVSAATSSSYTLLVQDGVFGSATVKALQRYLNSDHAANLVVDGVFGAATVRALQKFLGVSQDGVFGSGTKMALQRYLNNLPTYWKGGQTSILAVDGSFGSATITHLQAWLNVWIRDSSGA